RAGGWWRRRCGCAGWRFAGWCHGCRRRGPVVGGALVAGGGGGTADGVGPVGTGRGAILAVVAGADVRTGVDGRAGAVVDGGAAVRRVPVVVGGVAPREGEAPGADIDVGTGGVSVCDETGGTVGTGLVVVGDTGAADGTGGIGATCAAG